MIYRWNAFGSPHLVICTIAAAAIGLSACAEGAPKGPRRARPDQIPEQVSVDQGTTTYGFYTSQPRQPMDVAGFRIAKRPVTVAQYKQCIEAGACSAPAATACAADGRGDALLGPTLDVVDGGSLPATCVGITQAQAYCTWVGGGLPTIEQWMTAARGRTPTRFAWGNNMPRCEQRPDAKEQLVPCGAGGDPSFAVGHHVTAASPFLVEDVLLAPGELIAPSPTSPVSACAPPFAACVAYGVRPGAIDSVEVLDSFGNEQGERSSRAYSFRCAFSGDSQ